MEETGYIYKIINDINDKVYVGETTRNLELRFNEHCFDKRSTSKIHQAIEEYGWQHFKIIEIERPPLSKLFERKKYWIEYYKANYNSDPEEEFNDIKNNVRVVEANIYFESAETMSYEINNITSWTIQFCERKIKEALAENKKFLDYTLEYVSNQVTSIDERENWIKMLNVQYPGKRIYCPEVNMEFDTITSAANHLYQNDYYVNETKYAIQNLLGIIRKCIKNPDYVFESEKGPIHFEVLPGATKNSPFGNVNEIYCPQIDKTFSSQAEAAEYMLSNKIWTSIKPKTAKSRIDNVVNGIFPEYKGFSFEKVEDER